MKEIMVTRSSMPSMEEYINEISSLWDTHWLTNMGEKHIKLQQSLKDYLKVPEIELLTNGHMALELSLQALVTNNSEKFCRDNTDVRKKMEVITTPFTFASTTHAIVRNGLEPVFCDINASDFTIDVDMLEDLITDYTVAILPVHVYGSVCNVDEIQRIADRHGIKVIYDAAHAFGESVGDRGIGDFGDASCFSFHATKVFNTIEGGAVCYKDKAFGKEIYRLKNFGIKNEEVVDGIGANAKMNEFCAAMGICNLRHIDEEILKRKKISDYYDSLLGDVAGLTIRRHQEKVKSNYAYYPIVVDDKKFGKTRNEIFDELAKEGIHARKYFYPLTNSFECFHGKYDVAKTPIALHVSKHVLTLPMYADLDYKVIDKICSIILK